ncbi:MAG: hypothetical protein ACFFDV_12140 [Candidatus Thorarchaeota archaeon]
MTYPRDYRQEKIYGCTGLGAIIAVVVVAAVIIGITILGGAGFFYFFIPPSSEFEIDPGFLSAIPFFILLAAVSVVALLGSWLYSHSRQVDFEEQQTL